MTQLLYPISNHDPIASANQLLYLTIHQALQSAIMTQLFFPISWSRDPIALTNQLRCPLYPSSNIKKFSPHRCELQVLFSWFL